MDYGIWNLNIDNVTPITDYTKDTYNRISLNIIEHLNSLLNTVIFEDLTVETDRGNKYYIGFENDESPIFAIGWNTLTTSNSSRYLVMSGLYKSIELSNIFKTASVTDDIYGKTLVTVYPGNTSYNYQKMFYIKTDNFIGISKTGNNSQEEFIPDKEIVTAIVTLNDGKRRTIHKKPGSSYQEYMSYDVPDDFGQYEVWGCNNDLFYIKNRLANSNNNYMFNLFYTGIAFKDIKITNQILSKGSKYRINNTYYIVIFAGSKSSVLVKVRDE